MKLIRCDPPDHVIQKAQPMWEDNRLNKGRHVPAKQWYQCAECGLKLEDIHKLGRHITKHSTARSFQCPQCKRMYKTKDAVRKHVKEQHTPGFKFKVFCAYCGKGFKSRKHRDDHVTVHTGECAFKCSVCGKAFKNKRSVDGHMRTRHKIGKLHYCPLCECHFPFLNLLQNHLAGVHKAQVPQAMQQIFIHKCLICNEEFPDEHVLIQHMPIHGDQSCVACGRREKRRKNVIEEAIKRGVNPEDAATRDFEELEDWVREQKAKENAEKKEKKAKMNSMLMDKAILQGLDPQLAKDVKKTKEFLMQKRKEDEKRGKPMKFIGAGRLPLPDYEEEDEVDDAVLFKDVSKLGVDELRKCQVESRKQERQLKREMEYMKKTINQSAMEIALDIVESIEAEEVLGQKQEDKEMAVIRAELDMRNKRGKVQKSLVTISKKRTVGLQTDRRRDLEGEDKTETLTEAEKAAETLKEVIENQQLDPVLRFEAQKAYFAMKEPIRKSLDMMKIKEDGRKVLRGWPNLKKKPVIPIPVLTPHPESLSSEASCSAAQEGSENIKCTVYSQDPKVTLGLVKSGGATFVINKSKSRDVKGIHMVSKQSDEGKNSSSPKIVISTNIPDKVKEKLTAGKLVISVVPIKGMRLPLPKISDAASKKDKDDLESEELEPGELSGNAQNHRGKSPVRTSARLSGRNSQKVSLPVAKNCASTKRKTVAAAVSKRKRKAPALSTREELLQKGVKLIPCDPPDHVVQKAKKAMYKKSYNRATKQWYQCQHCGKKVEDISKLKLHIRVHDSLKDRLLREMKTQETSSEMTIDQDSDLEPGEVRIEPPKRSKDYHTESVSKKQNSSMQSSISSETTMPKLDENRKIGELSNSESTVDQDSDLEPGEVIFESLPEQQTVSTQSSITDKGDVDMETDAPPKSSEEEESPDQEFMETETNPDQREVEGLNQESMENALQESMQSPNQISMESGTSSDQREVEGLNKESVEDAHQESMHSANQVSMESGTSSDQIQVPMTQSALDELAMSTTQAQSVNEIIQMTKSTDIDISSGSQAVTSEPSEVEFPNSDSEPAL